MKHLLAIKFFLTGMVIFIIASTTSALHVLKSWELKYCALATAPRDWRHTEKLKEAPAALLHLSALDLDQTTLVQRLADVAEDLKGAGAKVVLIPIGVALYRSPENIESLERMKKTGIVIIGFRWRPDGFFNENNRKSWWSAQPLAGYRKQDSLGGVWAPLTVAHSEFQDIYSFIPYGIRHTWEGQTMYDATIQAVTMFAGGAGEAVALTDELHVGSHNIPLWGDGITYVKGLRDFPETAKEAMAETNFMTTKLSYNNSDKKSVLKIYAGKIVVVDWFDGTDFVWPSLGRRAWYVVNSIANDNFLVRTDEWDILLIMLFLCATAVLVFFFPSGRSVFGLLVLGGIFLQTCRWHIASNNIILDPLYPLATLALSILVFPVIKVLHEKNVLKQEVKSLKEEISSLAASKNTNASI